jgi:hypothetical protein
MKFKILTNASFDWKKRKRPKKPKSERSIPDKDLCAQKGQSYNQALQAENDYFYKGKPFQSDKNHV